MNFTGERLVPGISGEDLEIEHLDRYKFALQFVKDKTVLDAACGAGYGTSFLSSKAKHVSGIDISDEAIEYAKNQFLPNSKIDYNVASIEKLPFSDRSIDVVVSFETIEHVDIDLQNLFLLEIKRVLKSNGIMVMSTPNHDIYKKRGKNKYHIHEFSYKEFDEFLKRFFKNVAFFVQKWEISDVITNKDNEIALIKNNLNPETSEYLVAVCSNQELPEISSEICVKDDNDLEKLRTWAYNNHCQIEQNNLYISQLVSDKEKLEASERTLKGENSNQKIQLEQLLESERTLKLDKQCMQGHIEQLIESERSLQSENKCMKGHIEQLLESERKLHNENNDKQKNIDLLNSNLELVKKSLLFKFLRLFNKGYKNL